jgi:Cu+-exporting ATPase
VKKITERNMEHEQKVQTIENSMKDPVCNMNVDIKNALQHDFEGKTYYFCSEKCQSKFSAAPHLYTSSNKEIQHPVGHEKARHSHHFAQPSEKYQSLQNSATIFVFTMHPDVRQDHPGNCPKCCMTL